MIFSFSIGDRVIQKESRVTAEILLIIGDRKAKIRDEDGFEYIINISEILPLNSNTYNSSSYGRSFKIKEEDIIIPESIKPKKNKLERGGRVKIDLHIENLTTYYSHMQNSEMVRIQMEYCKKELDDAMLKSKHSLVIVHGIGEGVLKSEVHKLLKLYNLTFFESQDSGSTEVLL